MRGQHHDRGPRELREHGPQDHPLLRVDPGGRLVQDQHRRRAEQRLRQRDPPPLPAGHGPDPPGAEAGQPHQVEHPAHLRVPPGRLGPLLEQRDVIHERERGEAPREPGLLRLVAQLAADAGAPGRDRRVQAQHPDLSLGGRQRGGQQPQQRGLARAVGAEQPGHPGPQVQVDAGQRPGRAERAPHPAQADRSGHHHYLHGRSWRSRPRRTRKTTNEAAASTRNPAWARPWSTASGAPDRAASSQTTPSQAQLTAIGRAQRADPGRRGQHHRDEPDRRQQPRERCLPRYDQPGQQHRRQREREHRDRAQQDQPEHRIRRDEFRFQRRVQPRVVASRDHQARHDRRHRQEQPHPAGVPDRRRERGEHQDRGHPGQPHPAERAGHRDQPRLGGGQARAAQHPLEHRRPRHLHSIPGPVPHRGQIDHVDRGGDRGAHPRPARPAGQQVLLGRRPFGQRIGPLDVAPQHVVVEMPAGHDGPSARAARRCALAR